MFHSSLDIHFTGNQLFQFEILIRLSYRNLLEGTVARYPHFDPRYEIIRSSYGVSECLFALSFPQSPFLNLPSLGHLSPIDQATKKEEFPILFCS